MPSMELALCDLVSIGPILSTKSLPVAYFYGIKIYPFAIPARKAVLYTTSSIIASISAILLGPANASIAP